MSTFLVFVISLAAASVPSLLVSYTRMKKSRDNWIRKYNTKESQCELQRIDLKTAERRLESCEEANHKLRQYINKINGVQALKHSFPPSSPFYIQATDPYEAKSGGKLPDNGTGKFWLYTDAEKQKVVDHAGLLWNNYSEAVHAWKKLKGYKQIAFPEAHIVKQVSQEEIDKAKEELPDIIKEFTKE